MMRSVKKFLLPIVYWTLLISTPVHSQSLEDILQAVEAGQTRTVAGLLDKGLDANTTDKAGYSLLMLASRFGHREMVAMLIARKADVRRRSAVGDTALMMASLRGDLDTMKLLLEAGAEVKHEGWTPLHYAAFEGAAPAVRYLLEKGADKDAVAPNGYTPLMIAARNGKADAAKAILYEDPDVNFRTSTGETALKIARDRGMQELVELLRRAGGVE